MRSLFRAPATLAWAGSLLAVSVASAQTKVPTGPCYDASVRPRVVYVAGSSAARPFLGVVAKLMAQESPPTTVVYQSQGSCTGVEALYSANAQKRLIKDIPEAGATPANYAVYFEADGATVHECFLDPAGNTVDVGISDVYAQSCGLSASAGVEVTEYLGPVQPMTLVVPAASSQRTLSAEAGYLIFGLGGHEGAAAPFTDRRFYFVRNSKSGTQQMVARAVSVPAEKWWGIDRGGSSAIVSAMKLLVDPVNAEKAIGILSVDVADAERSNMRVLAFQAKDQRCGYWPDSSPTAFDKANVREGRYAIWGPLHFFARTSGGVPSEAAGALVSRFAAQRLDPALVEVVIQKHLVPQCAMRVTRSSEMGELKPFAPEFQCGCYFEAVANGATSCKACGGPGDCPAERPACNYGYCELN
ncbi:MAG: hypothetical protein IPG96_04820 [Proteobacteria bacterium]|nr:hypothetical protein [Pseudomonadota bacterium]